MDSYEFLSDYCADSGKDFEIVETTSEPSGYPGGLKWALTGFAG